MKMRIVFAGAAALAALGGLHSPAQAQGFKPTRPVEVGGAHRSGRRQRRAGARGGAHDGEGEAPAGAHAGREQARRRRRGGRGLSRGEEGRPEHHRLLHRRVAHRAAHQRRSQGHPERPDADRAPRARARGDRGQGRRAVQERCPDFIAAAKKSPGQLKQSGGSVTSRDNIVRQLLQKSTGAQLGVHLVPRRRRAHRRAAGRPRQHDGDRAGRGGRAHPCRQHARARAGDRQAPARLSPTCRR